MKCQKTINLLDNTPDQTSKFITKNWVEINDESKISYSTGSDIKFKTTVLMSSLCNYADVYITVKETIRITGAGDDDAAKRLHEWNKGIIFKNCAPFTKSISWINGTEIDNAQDIDIVMPTSIVLIISIVIIIEKYLEVYGNITKLILMIT